MSIWSFWWQLPGPGEFLGTIVDDLRDGSHVVVEWPLHGPQGWYRGFEEWGAELREDLQWYRFKQADMADLEPEEFIHQRILRKAVPISKLSPEFVAAHEDFHGRLIILENPGVVEWLKWRRYLEDYARASQSVDPWQRTRILVSLTGACCLSQVREDVCLKRHRWDGRVSPLDMSLFAAFHVRHRSFRRLEARLVNTLLTTLSAWDPCVVEALCDASVSELCSTEEPLQAIAMKRGWTTELPDDRDTRWAQGMVQRFDGADVVHGALPNANDHEWSLDYHRWHAQMNVLLPIVERERRRLIMKLRNQLEVPFTPKDGATIDDVFDMEIGHLWYQMKKKRRDFNDHDVDLVGLLRDVRNELAHFDPLSPVLLEKCLRVL